MVAAGFYYLSKKNHVPPKKPEKLEDVLSVEKPSLNYWRVAFYSFMIPVGILTFYNLSIASSIRTRVSRIFLLENNYKFDRIILENYNGKL